MASAFSTRPPSCSAPSRPARPPWPSSSAPPGWPAPRPTGSPSRSSTTAWSRATCRAASSSARASASSPSAAGEDRLLAAAGPVLGALRDHTNESAQLFRRQGDQRICVAAAERPVGLRDSIPVGATLSMQAGSAAQVLLAWEEPDRLHRGLQGAEFTATALSGVRRRGWAQSVGEREPGVASVSAPVRGPSGPRRRRRVDLRPDRAPLPPARAACTPPPSSPAPTSSPRCCAAPSRPTRAPDGGLAPRPPAAAHAAPCAARARRRRGSPGRTHGGAVAPYDATGPRLGAPTAGPPTPSVAHPPALVSVVTPADTPRERARSPSAVDGDLGTARSPDGIRTRATALRGRRARPLHNGALAGAVRPRSRAVSGETIPASARISPNRAAPGGSGRPELGYQDSNLD